MDTVLTGIMRSIHQLTGEAMRIKDRIEFKTKPPVLTFKSDDMVMDAVKAMSEKNYGAIVIIDGVQKPIGIVTERDFMRRLLLNNLDPNTTPLSRIMTSDLRVVTENDKIVECIRMMSNERFRHLPVVDQEGKLVSLVSQGDFVSYTWPQLLLDKKDVAVRSFMERHNFFLIFGSIMVYTIIILFILSAL